MFLTAEMTVPRSFANYCCTKPRFPSSDSYFAIPAAPALPAVAPRRFRPASSAILYRPAREGVRRLRDTELEGAGLRAVSDTMAGLNLPCPRVRSRLRAKRREQTDPVAGVVGGVKSGG